MDARRKGKQDHLQKEYIVLCAATVSKRSWKVLAGSFAVTEVSVPIILLHKYSHGRKLFQLPERYILRRGCWCRKLVRTQIGMERIVVKIEKKNVRLF